MTTRLEGQPQVQTEGAAQANQRHLAPRSSTQLGIASTNDTLSTSWEAGSPGCLILIFRALMSCIDSLFNCFFSLFDSEREVLPLPPEKVPQDPQQLRDFRAAWLDNSASFSGDAFMQDFGFLRQHVRESLMQAVENFHSEEFPLVAREINRLMKEQPGRKIENKLLVREAVVAVMRKYPPTPSFIRQFEIELGEAEAVEAAQILALNSES